MAESGNLPVVDRLRFLRDDPGALWDAGETAMVLYVEYSQGYSLFGLRLERDDQVITLTDPIERGIAEVVNSGV